MAGRAVDAGARVGGVRAGRRLLPARRWQPGGGAAGVGAAGAVRRGDRGRRLRFPAAGRAGRAARRVRRARRGPGTTRARPAGPAQHPGAADRADPVPAVGRRSPLLHLGPDPQQGDHLGGERLRLAADRVVVVARGRLAGADHTGRADDDRGRRRPGAAARDRAWRPPARRRRARPAVGGGEPGRRRRCREPGRRALDRLLRQGARREDRPRCRPAHTATGDRDAHARPARVDRARGRPVRLLDRRRRAAPRRDPGRRRGHRRVPQHLVAWGKDRPRRGGAGRVGGARRGAGRRTLDRLPRAPARQGPAPVAAGTPEARGALGGRVRRGLGRDVLPAAAGRRTGAADPGPRSGTRTRSAAPPSGCCGPRPRSRWSRSRCSRC